MGNRLGFWSCQHRSSTTCGSSPSLGFLGLASSPSSPSATLPSPTRSAHSAQSSHTLFPSTTKLMASSRACCQSLGWGSLRWLKHTLCDVLSRGSYGAQRRDHPAVSACSFLALPDCSSLQQLSCAPCEPGRIPVCLSQRPRVALPDHCPDRGHPSLYPDRHARHRRNLSHRRPPPRKLHLAPLRCLFLCQGNLCRNRDLHKPLPRLAKHSRNHQNHLPKVQGSRSLSPTALITSLNLPHSPIPPPTHTHTHAHTHTLTTPSRMGIN